MKILQSKLLTPKTGEAIRRSRDLSLGDEITRKRITTVTAGAGYGKTTFVARAVADKETVWYRLAEADTDLFVFLNYLAEGISGIYPRFGEEFRGYFRGERIIDKEKQAVIVYFLHALETVVDRELVIVLDEFHQVQESREIMDCLQFLVENLPPAVHIILISRAQVRLALSRLRVMGEIVEVTEKDLAFTPADTVRLFEQTFGMSLRKETIWQINNRCKGWIAGLILFCHALRGKGQGEVEEILVRLKGSGRVISEYLEENVFSFLPEQTKIFLLKTSLLSRLNRTLCDRFMDMDDSGEILRYLEMNHLFTYALDDIGQEYYYHHLFQDFLASGLAAGYSESEIAALHIKAGRLSEDMGMVEDAITHYLAAREYPEACRSLIATGGRMLMEGRMRLVGAFLDRIPNDIVKGDPQLLYIGAHVKMALGMVEEAIEGFKNARDIFSEQGQQVGIDLCELDLGNTYFPLGYFREAEEQFTRILQSPTCDPMVRDLVLTQLVFISAYLGKLDDADRYFREGMTHSAGIPEKMHRVDLQAWLAMNHCIRYLVSGDSLEGTHRCEQAAQLLEGSENHRLRCFLYNHASMAYSHARLYEKGLENANAGLKLIREKGFRDQTLGWLLLGCCMNYMGLKKYSEASEYGRQAMMFFTETGSLWGEASVCATLGLLFLKSGDIHAAEDIITRGLKVLDRIDIPMIKAQLLISLVMIRALQGNIPEAESILGDSYRQYPESKVFSLLQSCVLSYLSMLKGRKDLALVHARQYLKIAQANRYDLWILEHLLLLLVPLAELYEQGEMKEYLEGIFRKIDPDLKATLHQMESMGILEISRACRIILDAIPAQPPPGLKVYTFGRFHVYLGDNEIPAQNWTSRKARMLFKLLVRYRPKGYMNKEVFMEHLWPEEDPLKTAKRFHVALAALRKILEPSLTRGMASSYILSDGDNYLLDIGDGGYVDLDAFEDAFAQARNAADNTEAVQHLLRAAEIFQGDFLEEDLYAPWCIAQRERLNEDYLSVLVSIADYFEMKKDYQKAIDYCNRYLAKDAYAEDVYQRLMGFHAQLGNRTMVKKTYERCRKSIVDELECPLSSETERLARELIPAPDIDSR